MRHFIPLFILASAIVMSTSSAACESSDMIPKDPEHPASPIYKFRSKKTVKKFNGRKVTYFLPTKNRKPLLKAPVVVFGHGSKAFRFTYEKMFRHLNGKGIAVIFPQYEGHYFDNEYATMGKMFILLANESIRAMPKYIDEEKVVFSGHSDGAFMALTAAGLSAVDENSIRPQSIVVAATSGIREKHYKNILPETKVTLLVGDKDFKTPASRSKLIYNMLEVTQKQLIILKSFGKIKADHGSIRNVDWTGFRTNVLHYQGYWKYITAAALELNLSTRTTERFIYGDATQSDVCDDYKFEIERSWDS